jgi:hypothetical protein
MPAPHEKLLRQRDNATAKKHDSHEESLTQSKHLLSSPFQSIGKPISDRAHSGALYVVAVAIALCHPVRPLFGGPFEVSVGEM